MFKSLTDPRHAFMRASASLAVVALVVTTCIVMIPLEASAADGGTLLLEDSFRYSSVVSDKYVIGGRAFTPCLTASGVPNSNGSIVPRKCAAAADSPGSGALRLTEAVNNQAGFLLYNHALPTKAGLDIEFRFFEYGGSGGVAGADGISFFLTKGTASLSEPGAYGGSLGYHFNSIQDGISNALLGVGFDAWGNFGVETNDPACTAQTGIVEPTDQPANANTVGIRGPGNGRSGYCLLAQPQHYSGGIGLLNGNRTTALRKARIVIDPPTNANPRVKVYVASGESGDVSDSTAPLLNVAEPPEFKTNSTFKFGWAASTGGSTNIHEINFLEVSSVDPIPPELEITADDAPAANAGEVTNAVIRPTISSAGGPESKDIAVDLVRSGVEYASTPAGTGWTCSLNGDEYRCVYAVSTMQISGTTLPPITVPLKTSTADQTGTFSGVTATVDSDDNFYSTPKSATASASWRPVIGNSTGSAVASMSPDTVTLSAPSVSGSPITGYEIVTPPSASEGTASISASGIPSFTPAAGSSGVATFTYRALGAGGVHSLTNGIGTVTVKPVASARNASTVVNTRVTIPNSQAPLGTGPFTYTVTQPISGGSAAINPSTGAIDFTPTTGFSGVSTFTYTATDADGVAATPQSVTVTVAPVASGTTLDVTLDADGAASGTTAPPTTTGSAPFTFTKTFDPAIGTATINSSTGAVSYVAETGVSGVASVKYTASSGGSTSAEATSTITVHPFLSTVAGSTDASTEVTLSPPDFVGSGTPSYSIAPPTKGAASIDSATGVITFDPQGHSGVITIDYTVRDESGVDTTQTATITVDPVAVPLTATVAASATPVAKAMDVTPTGDGPWTYQIVSGLDPSQGSVAATTTGVAITPAASVSGTLEVTYRVKGADDIWSAPTSATLTVTPVVVNATIEITLDSGGEATGTTTIPTPTGSGPFEFSKIADSPHGTVAIGASDGMLSYSISDGSSGVFTATYSVADGDGVDGNVGTLTITVRPFLATLTATTDADTPVILDGSTAVGTPPSGHRDLQFAIPTAPSEGSATIDVDNGEITFDPQGHSGIVTFSYTVTGADDVTTTSDVTVTSRPVTDALAATVVATDSPASIAMTATPIGDGPFTYEIVDGVSSSKGTSAASTDGVETTPAAGVSGVLGAIYRVQDSDGVWSLPRSATLTVTPRAADGRRVVQSGTTTIVDFPRPTGVGPFLFAIVNGLPSDWGKATVTSSTGSSQRLSVKVPSTKSGQVQLTYNVSDIETLKSQVAALDLVVSPVAADLDLGSVRASTSAGSKVEKTLPTPSGTGPFRYEIVSAPPASRGTVKLDPATGNVVITPRSGTSGRLTFTYRVTDAASLISNTATVKLLVMPAAGIMAGPRGLKAASGGRPSVPRSLTTVGRTPLKSSVPKPVGTGPFTYRIVTPPDPSQGTLIIDPDTGEVRFVAAPGFHGTVHFAYVVVDGDGLESEPQPMEIQVLGEKTERSSRQPRALAFTGNSALTSALAGAVMLAAGVVTVEAVRRRQRSV